MFVNRSTIAHFSSKAGLICLFVLAPIALGSTQATAEMNQEQRGFDSPPQIVQSNVTVRSPLQSSIYRLVITVPANAVESLQALTLRQRVNQERLDFDRSGVRATLGNEFNEADQIPLARVGGEESTENEVIVAFDRPIQPGQTVTIEIPITHNPRNGGNYQLEVKAFPQGPDSDGLVLGTEALNFWGFQ
jgi:hypothetical protein